MYIMYRNYVFFHAKLDPSAQKEIVGAATSDVFLNIPRVRL